MKKRIKRIFYIFKSGVEMNRRIIWIIGWLLPALSLIAQPVSTGSDVRIVRVRGDVQVRRGMEENWSPAGTGMELKPLDTIFAGEASEAVLLLEDSARFILRNNSVLDAGDLRRITERQMFLFLMSRKIGRITASDSGSGTPIRITNVSVVRGADKSDSTMPSAAADLSNWVREKNGARALFEAGYATNTVVKLNKIIQRYPSLSDGGEIQFGLGQAFETLNETGRAIDAYHTALEQADAGADAPRIAERKARIEAAIKRLTAEGAENAEKGTKK